LAPSCLRPRTALPTRRSSDLTRVTSLPAHRNALEARRTDWRQVPLDRRADQRLPARGNPPHFRADAVQFGLAEPSHLPGISARPDRKSTRLNSSHLVTSYAVF